MGAEAAYECDAGFYLKRGGRIVRKCSRDRAWHADEEDACERIPCPVPEPVTHGRVLYEQEDLVYQGKVVVR